MTRVRVQVPVQVIVNTSLHVFQWQPLITLIRLLHEFGSPENFSRKSTLCTCHVLAWVHWVNNKNGHHKVVMSTFTSLLCRASRNVCAVSLLLTIWYWTKHFLNIINGHESAITFCLTQEQFTNYELSACTSDCERSTRTSEARTGKYQPIHGNPYSYSRQCECGLIVCTTFSHADWTKNWTHSFFVVR